jgi:CRISPR-associated protein Csc3
MTNSTTTKDDITHLAELAYDALRPTSDNDKPYAIERVFRESVKAVTDSDDLRMNPEEAVEVVTGRLMKLPERSGQVRRVSQNEIDSSEHLNERIRQYAEAFVERVLIGRCEGKPALVKRRANNLADGFYAATLRLKYDSSDETDETTDDHDATQ